MKNLIVLLSMAVSFTAAAEPKVDYLVYRSSNGTVSPMFRSSTMCSINSNNEVYTRKITGDIAKSTTKKIKWQGIRNATILQSLIIEASNTEYVLAKQPLPMGGRLTTFSSVIKGQESKLKSMTGGVLGGINPSEASTRLVAFLELNCVVPEAK